MTVANIIMSEKLTIVITSLSGATAYRYADTLHSS